MNLYGYGGSSPFVFMDPWGLFQQAQDFVQQWGASNEAIQWQTAESMAGYWRGYNDYLNPRLAMDGTPLTAGMKASQANYNRTIAQQQGIGSASRAAQRQMIGEMGVGMIPVVGEFMDYQVMTDPNAAWWERSLAGLSLGVNCFTAGLLPNAGPIIRSLRAGDDFAAYADDMMARAGGVASSGVASRRFWTKSKMFNGNKVFQRDDLIDPSRVDARGRTNLERMQRGLAPLGPDNKSINLHHLTQTQDGAIAEVSQTFHQQNYGTLHINPNTIPSGIDRIEFNAWRDKYWRDRARDFEESP
ncbi:MAG: HNH/ENDO VII family nuclease [Planctomycetota bacterium]